MGNSPENQNTDPNAEQSKNIYERLLQKLKEKLERQFLSWKYQLAFNTVLNKLKTDGTCKYPLRKISFRVDEVVEGQVLGVMIYGYQDWNYDTHLHFDAQALGEFEYKGKKYGFGFSTQTSRNDYFNIKVSKKFAEYFQEVVKGW